MFKKLYKSVFEVEQLGFNRDRDYLTVFINLGTQNEFTDKLYNSISHYLDDSIVEKLEDLSSMGCEKIVSGLRNRQTNSIGIETNYTFLINFCTMGLTDAHNKLSAYFSALREGRVLRGKDRITVLIVLPDDKKKAEYLTSLEEILAADNIVSYVFIKEIFQEDRLVEDICAAIVLNSDKDIYSKITGWFENANVIVENNLLELTPEGKEYYSRKKPVSWSFIRAYFNDEKMLFLKSFVKYLVSNPLNITDDEFSDFCEEYYTDNIGTPQIDQWINLLDRAIKMIPKTSIKLSSDNTFENYFDQAYGMRGSEIVELTMKINLKDLNKYENHHIESADMALMRFFDGINSKDIVSDIILKLTTYISNKTIEIETCGKDLREELKKVQDVVGGLPKYISKYIKYTVSNKQKEFWERIKNNLETNKDRFKEFYEKSKELNDKIQETAGRLMYDQTIEIHGSEARHKAGEIFANEYSADLCREIREAYSKYRNDIAAPDMEHHWEKNEFYNSIYTTIRTDYENSFDVRGVYTLAIQQRIFKYFEFPNTNGEEK